MCSMNKDDFGDIVKIMKDTWGFWDPTTRESRAWGAILKAFSYDEAEAAIKSHRAAQLRLRQPPQAPEIDAIKKLLTSGEPKTAGQIDFERWFLGNPPHHVIDGVPDSTAVRIRRLFFQRDVDRDRLHRHETEGMSHDRLEYRIDLTNQQLEHMRSVRPESYERGVRSYAESGHRIGRAEDEAAIAASRGNWEPEPPETQYEHAREEIPSDVPF